MVRGGARTTQLCSPPLVTADTLQPPYTANFLQSCCSFVLTGERQVIDMFTTTVYLPEIADVAEFVNIMSQFRFEALLQVGSYSVDAKSIMGIFTLDREQPLQLEAGTDDEAQIAKLTQAIGRFLFHPVH